MKVQVVLGPPGTGKTRTLIEMISGFIKDGFDASQIGYFSFTRAGALEAASRWMMDAGQIDIRTVHSFVFRALGLSRQQVVNQGKLQEFSEIIGYPVYEEFGGYNSAFEKGPRLMAEYQKRVAMMTNVHHDLPTDVDADEYEIFSKTYDRWKKVNGFLDFNDMLLNFLADKQFDQKLGVMIVDEAQDLSDLQLMVVEKLAMKCQLVVMAGDDDQCLFEWAGANPAGFVQMFPHADVRVLEQSWRVPKAQFKLAHRLTDSMQFRAEKKYQPVDKPGRVEQCSSFEDAFIEGDTMILYRNHSVRASVEETLHKCKLPYDMLDKSRSWFNGRQAQAVRAYQAAATGKPISDKGLQNLLNHLPPSMASDVAAFDFKSLRKHPWQRVLQMDGEISDYLDGAIAAESAGVKPVRMGTIHASKGLEADNIILINQLGERTYENLDSSEYRVWYVGVTRSRERLQIVDGTNPMQELFL